MKVNHPLRSACWAVAAGLCLALVGCGSGDVDLYEVSGRLTHNGTPIAELEVVFYPDNSAENPLSSGFTDDEGKFVMMVGTANGVAPGNYTVYVQDPAALQGGQTSEAPDYQAVLNKYGSLEESSYKITIDDDLHDLELKLD
jgi:hypothetical protein